MKKIKYLVFLSTLVLLSACSFGETTDVKLSNILTEIYDLESDYRDVQPKLAEMEVKEQSNFLSMMELTKDQKDKLEVQVESTAKLLEERLSLVEKEKESIQKAADKISDIDGLISETEEEAEKESLKLVQESLKIRYESYNNLTEQYTTLANLQEELYKMLIAEDAEVGTIQEQVGKVNKQNEFVQKEVQKFNDLTAQLNQVKEEVFVSLQTEEK